MIPIVDTVIKAGEKILDKFIPDANVLEQAKSELRQAGVEMAKLEASDRDSARKREMEVKDTTPRNLAIGITVALVAGAGWFSLYPPTEANRSLVEMFGSALRDGWIMMIAYYFGASHSMRGEPWKLK